MNCINSDIFDVKSIIDLPGVVNEHSNEVIMSVVRPRQLEILNSYGVDLFDVFKFKITRMYLFTINDQFIFCRNIPQASTINVGYDPTINFDYGIVVSFDIDLIRNILRSPILLPTIDRVLSKLHMHKLKHHLFVMNDHMPSIPNTLTLKSSSNFNRPTVIEQHNDINYGSIGQHIKIDGHMDHHLYFISLDHYKNITDSLVPYDITNNLAGHGYHFAKNHYGNYGRVGDVLLVDEL